MKTLTISYDEGLLAFTGQKPTEFEEEARFLLALKLFELRRISAGKAAELCDMTKPDFIIRSSQLGIPVVDLDEDQMEIEFRDA